ncbi:MAG: hypothetical protein MJ090_03600 [Clostridia bacterium]|nr:hypothetical protein [Clostridia bacterium]
MYHCTDCKKDFDYPKKLKETDGDFVTVSRITYVCPKCGSENIKEKKIRYCKCCGRTVSGGREDYCSVSCRKQGEKLYEQQKIKYLHIKKSPIYETARMLEAYNKEHNLNLSYGQFTATVLPVIERQKNNENKRRKNEIS